MPLKAEAEEDPPAEKELEVGVRKPCNSLTYRISYPLSLFGLFLNMHQLRVVLYTGNRPRAYRRQYPPSYQTSRTLQTRTNSPPDLTIIQYYLARFKLQLILRRSSHVLIHPTLENVEGYNRAKTSADMQSAPYIVAYSLSSQVDELHNRPNRRLCSRARYKLV